MYAAAQTNHEENLMFANNATLGKILACTLSGLGAIALSSCASQGGTSNERIIVSKPTGIYISIKNNVGKEEFSCVTPCKIIVDRPRKIVASKEGYVSQTFYLEPGRGIVNVILELTAASEGVDEVGLPELN